ncbi:MAG: putative ATP-dependent helicase Lhr [Methanoregulaceae archaeon PtaB.Bin056]|nr:MAG: putative ATP-dependent helicase Lhr [Methanoregulaceae archaeon PtaB.Bin056]
MRRLRRVSRHYGSEPSFFLSTATLANPGEFASRLCGIPCREIGRDGSPHGPRTFLFYNPFHEWPAARSVHRDTALLLSRCLDHGMQTLCFTGARKTAELVALWAGGTAPGESGIAAYRAGYLPEERRRIEEGLRSGSIRGVVSTNALEVGIDIGSLGGVILSGFPGTMMAAWQQAGRAGRSRGESLAVLVAFANPLDQYFMRHPGKFFGASHEHAIIDLGNPYILSGQVLCAGAELPLDCERDQEFFGPSLPDIVAAHERESLLGKTRRGWIYSGSRRASDLVGMDGSARETFRVLSRGRLLETMDRSQAFREAHPGAILIHQGEQYRVDACDLAAKTIHATPVEVEYYTRPLKSVQIRVTAVRARRALPGAGLTYGDVEVTEQYTAYKLLKSETVIGIEPLDLPPLQFSTRALWIGVPPGSAEAIGQQGGDLAGGLHAMEHAMIAVMPFHVLCDRWDIGGLSVPCGGDLGDPTIYLYDGYEGGIGLAEKGYDLCEEILGTARTLIGDCRCESGCPACILSPKCGNDNQPLDKAAALHLLSLVSGAGAGKK